MKPLQVYLPESFIKQLKLKALNSDCTVSDLVRRELGADVEIVDSKPIPTNFAERVLEKSTGFCKNGHPIPEGRDRCLGKGCKYS